MAKLTTPARRSVALRLLAELERDEGHPKAAGVLDEIAEELDALRAEVKRLKDPKPPRLDHEATLNAAAEEVRDYGSLALFFRTLKAQGWTKHSVDYVRARVWFE